MKNVKTYTSEEGIEIVAYKSEDSDMFGITHIIFYKGIDVVLTPSYKEESKRDLKFTEIIDDHFEAVIEKVYNCLFKGADDE